MARVLRSAVLGVSYPAAAASLTEDPAAVLAPSGDRLSIRVGEVEIAREVRLSLEEPTSLERPIAVTAVPFRVEASERTGWFPVLVGELELTRASPGCELTLDAEYRVPGSVVGAIADRVLLHNAAERSVSSYFDEVSRRLRQRAEGVEALTGIPD